MPLYEYQCEVCGHRFEVIQKFSDAPIDACPKCGSPVRKLQSSPAFQFKGSGWYVTDYARKDAAPKDPKDTRDTKDTKDAKEGTKETKEATKDGKESTKDTKESAKEGAKDTKESAKETKTEKPPSSGST